ncbi:hemerythrin domain-containing protein [Dactylosporangium sp. NPDC050688]|uniref:hemerythrin domain-containing protein n=1 Tax=Dactylosporangium sp. NPDC050688 TaxID=3157217 RepID=UPI0033DAD6E7
MEQDLVDLLVAEHRRIESLFADIETAQSPAERRAALDAAVTVLAAHTATEERLLHRHLPEELAGYEAAEHRRIDDLMARLAEPNDVDPAFEVLLAALLEAVREHFQEEETELFPRLPKSVRVTE